MELIRAYQMADVLTTASSLVDTAQNIPINDRVFMIENAGAQPLYFNPITTATVANSFVVPANTILPHIFSCHGNLSVLSNATGTTVKVLILDV